MDAFHRNPDGLTLDDLVYLTGLEKNSITAPRLNLEKRRLILKSEDRRLNKNRTRSQRIYYLNQEANADPQVVRGGWHL